MTRIYLVRHGETDWNATERCQGTVDVPLNARGRNQAEALANALRDVRFDAAYTSPLERARHTAETILRRSDVRVTSTRELCEMSYGAWQGLTPDEWPGDARRQWTDTPWQVTFPEGESLDIVRQRVAPVIDQIVSRHAGETVLISGHGHANRVILIGAGYGSQESFWDIAQPNGSAWVLEYDNGSTRATRISRLATADAAAARRAIDAKTKPLGALGRLEDVAVRLAVLQGTLTPSVECARVCVFGADHGVALEGVSAYPRTVTAEMMRNFDRGGAAINVIAAANNVSVEVIDVGVDADLTMHAGIRHEKVRCGSRNCVDEPAMTADELDAALEVGKAAARRAVADGVRALGLGEMGIGNTTVASALLSALTGHAAAATVGRGTGVSDDVLAKKGQIVNRVLGRHAREAAGGHDPRELLRSVGGLELAAIAGAALEAARHRVAVVVDGFISTVAVLCAMRMRGAEHLADALFFAHRSAESGHGIALEACAAMSGCDARPLLQLDMRLGEGSGAALAMPILRAAAAIMRDMATFDSAGVSAGEHAAEHRTEFSE